MLLAYDYPLLGLFWTIMILAVLGDDRLRRDLGLHRQLPPPRSQWLGQSRVDAGDHR